MGVPGLSFEVVNASGPVLGIRADKTAMIALTERGPSETPTLVHSIDDFTAQFGDPLPGMLGALSAQGYYDNGGEELIVARFVPAASASAAVAVPVVGATAPAFVLPFQTGSSVITSGGTVVVSNNPGNFGNSVQVETTLTVRRRGKGTLQSSTSWVTAQVYAVGALVVSNGSLYVALGPGVAPSPAGTSGATAPSGSAAVVFDGGVSWQFLAAAAGGGTVFVPAPLPVGSFGVFLPIDVGVPLRIIAGTPAVVQWGKIVALSADRTTVTFAYPAPASPGWPPPMPGPPAPPPPALVEVYEPTFTLTISEPDRADVVISGLDLRSMVPPSPPPLNAGTPPPVTILSQLAGTTLTVPLDTPNAADVELPAPGRLTLSGGSDGLAADPLVAVFSADVQALAGSFTNCIAALEIIEDADLLPDIVIAPDLWSAVWGTKGLSFLAFDQATAISLADQMVLSAWRTSDRVVVVDPPLTNVLSFAKTGWPFLAASIRPFTPLELIPWRAARVAYQAAAQLGYSGPVQQPGSLVGLVSFGTDFAATFTPWPRIVGGGTYRGDDTLLVPPSGYVAGRMAQTSRQQGPWIATGNVSIEDVISLESNLTIADQETLQGIGISPLLMNLPVGASIQGVRALSWPERQLQPGPLPGFGFLSTRRLVNYLRRAVTPVALSYVFEQNAPATWIALHRDLTRMLRDLFLGGAFAGAQPEDGFFVRIDSTLNPPDARDNGVMTAQIGIAPAYPLEFLEVLLIVQGNTASVTEAPL